MSSFLDRLADMTNGPMFSGKFYLILQ